MLKRRVTAFILMLIMSISIVLVGCSDTKDSSDSSGSGKTIGSNNNSEGKSGQEEKEQSEEATLSTHLSEPVKFSYLRPVWGPATHEAGSDYEKILFEKANVVIEPMIVPVIDYETKFPTLVAGGNMPDVVWHAGPQWGVTHDLIEQGAFLALDEYLEKYPAVKAAISDGLWDMVKSPDGKHYFFPMPLCNYVPFPIYYRTDVFKELGINEPSTIDELVEALKVIRDNKPDMVPLTAHEYTLWYFQNVAVAFGYGFGNWIPDPNDANRIIPSNITPNHKEFLGWLQMLRKENLIDPDYMIAKGKLGVDKFNAGTAAVMVGHWGGLPDWLTELRKVEPNADVSFMKALEGPHGKMGCVTLSGFDRGFSISAKSKDKADNIFKFLNWVYTEGYEFMKWGVEGEMYTVDSEGNKVSIPDEERKPGFQRPNVEPFAFPLKSEDTVPNLGQDWKTIYDIYKARGLEHKVDMVRNMFEEMAGNAFPNYNRMTYSKTEGEKGQQLYQQYILPMQEKIVIDPTAPLTLFDEAIENWLKNGGQQIIDEVNEAQPDKSKPNIKYEYNGREY